jgi:two-component system cell cycle sensor histidine kinase PleC
MALSMLANRAEKDRLIEELKREKASAEEERAKAEAASLAKSKFLANMSHELRTPLTAIMGFAEVMKDEYLGPLGNPKYKPYAADIHASGEHLLKMIDEVLDLSRIEAGKYKLSEKAVDFGAVARECMQLLRLDAQAKQVRLTTTFKDMPRVFADERAVKQVCLNLLANAIKFTPEHGTVILAAGLLPGGEAYLTVRDNGPGIPEDEIATVMSAFGQGKLALDTGAKGTGLGLPIVAGLAELHGGRFELKSKPGSGTDASLIMPKSRVMPYPPAQAARKLAEIVTPFPLRGAA